MEMIELHNSHIPYGKYENHTLILQFDRGARYAYYNVPQSVWEGLLDSYDRFAYFNEAIRGAYRYARL